VASAFEAEVWLLSRKARPNIDPEGLGTHIKYVSADTPFSTQRLTFPW
jgi:hypothetical protein